MKNPFVRKTSETERLRKSLGEHASQIRRLLSAPDRDTTNAYIFLAGNLRTLLCDAYPILLRYAEVVGHDLRIWGPNPTDVVPRENVIMSVHFLIASYESSPLMHEMSIKEYLKFPIGVANWQKYTPTDIIKLVANKEGAAHLEPRQNEQLDDIKTAFVISVPVPGLQATDDIILRTTILQISVWSLRAIEDILSHPVGLGDEAGAG